MRIIFMGTPEFAVASLDALVRHGYDVAAVITAPDKPAGRGLQLQQSAVKQYAVSKNIPVLQPEKLKNPAFLEELRSYNADLQVVVAFRMLPEMVWNMPRFGTVNVHASLLPQYRGAAPINWAVINGEKESGVTTFRLQHEIDTGNILYASKVPIRDDETAGELYDALMKEGAKVLIQTVSALEKGDITGTVQNNIPPEELKHAPKIFKEDCRIDWEMPVERIYNLIRGLSPYPTAFTVLQDKTLKIFKAEKELSQHSHAPGSVHSDQKTYLKFAAPGGYIHVTDIQLEGKKRMGVVEFLRGFRF
ncbi:methionyl-tRNA formyltransferase [Chitinophaga sp. GCM10012297]|uniref:Methionyl-tRNA formyltransferase n=1 Tax=Chitinophaga chungangae TaxID=2821488 RepID=A0ABS3Y918_9BACT|nr:methionyl-tRNA formyltransferase [Chitinophaga chungangae]MBO9151174.1 methionyl-tRNA formyltransferase [Chitinophaga chungangae]